MMIRPMVRSDAADAAKLEIENFSSPWTEDDFLEMLDLSYVNYFAAEVEGIFAGCVGLRNIAGEGEIINVSVSKAFRRQGVASRLMERLLEEGRRLEISSFTLEVRTGNEAAIGLYKKFGFAGEGVRRNFYANPSEDALIMWKR